MQELDKWNKELERLSSKTYKEMDSKLFKFYRKALKDLKKEVKVYIENYDSLSFSKRLEAERRIQASNQIDEILWKMEAKTQPNIRNHVKEQAKQAYYGTFYALNGAEKLQLNFRTLSESYIERLVDKKVAGSTLSKRLYAQRDNLAKTVTNELLMGATKGKGYDKVAQRVGELTEANYKQALRIARTEGGRAQSASKQKAYEEAKEQGVSIKKRWLATLDKKIRSQHQILDGQEVEVEEQFNYKGSKADGPRLFGVAALDINCRCTTITVVNNVSPDVRRDNETREVIDYKNYDEWIKDKGVV